MGLDSGMAGPHCLDCGQPGIGWVTGPPQQGPYCAAHIEDHLDERGRSRLTARRAVLCLVHPKARRKVNAALERVRPIWKDDS